LRAPGVCGVLEEAGLVAPVRKCRQRFNHLNAMPIQAIHELWIGPHAASAAARLHRLQAELEREERREEPTQPPAPARYLACCLRGG